MTPTGTSGNPGSAAQRPFPVIMGPTASGKTSLAIAVAKAASGEVISADSMQIYKNLDIGTAKPSQSERAGIRHHLIDIAHVSEKYDVFRFLEDAGRIIHDIRTRGNLPVVAGGTGLYMRALIYGMDSLPADEQLKAELFGKFDSDEAYPVLKELMLEKDPLDFERFQPNRRRLIRAYEVFMLTGVPMCELQKRWGDAKPRTDAVSFFLSWNRELLKERIRARCEKMLAEGWMEEALKLIDEGLLKTPTAWQALGYRQICDYASGKIGRDELSDRIVTATWQFARRQLTWFRNQHPEAHIIEMPRSENAAVSYIISILDPCAKKARTHF